MLDELLLGGEIQETSKKNVLKAIAAQDLLQEVCKIYTWVMYYMTSINRDLALLRTAVHPLVTTRPLTVKCCKGPFTYYVMHSEGGGG